MRILPHSLLGMLALVGAACGPSLPAGRSDQPSVAAATGRATVTPTDGPTTPLIVDWQPEQRGDLEEAIHDGVVVVAHDEKGFRILKQCHAVGDYGYIGMTTKTQVIRLESAQEVSANLPLGGIGIAGTIGGGFEQGETLDIALAMIGKKRTTSTEISKTELKGKCDGATHYVRGITVGAFAMKTGTKDKVRAAAEIFGIGASGSSASSKGVDTTDGKLDACDKASPDSESPPGQCGALLRIELEPISNESDASEGPKSKGAAAAGPGDDKPEVATETFGGCAKGLVFVDGKCAKPQANKPHVCVPTDAADCSAQCDKGNPESCDRLGVLAMRGASGAPDKSKAKDLFDKACKGGVQSGCSNLAVVSGGGSSSIAMQEKACDAGATHACVNAGYAYRAGAGVPKDVPKALRLFTKGCNGGEMNACNNLSVLYAGAEGVARDDKKSAELAARACLGGEPFACGNAGLHYEFGMAVQQDFGRAAAMFERSCRMSKANCFRLGILSQTGQGVPKDEKRAKALYDDSCHASGSSLSPVFCYVGNKLYGGGAKPLSSGQVEAVLKTMQPQCDQKVARACGFAGAALVAGGKSGPGQAQLTKACEMKDAWACDLAKRLK